MKSSFPDEGKGNWMVAVGGQKTYVDRHGREAAEREYIPSLVNAHGG